MDFETRQKQAIEEVNSVLAKYGVSLQTMLDIRPQGIVPVVRLVDMVKEAEVVKDAEYEETKPKKKGKK